MMHTETSAVTMVGRKLQDGVLCLPNLTRPLRIIYRRNV